MSDIGMIPVDWEVRFDPQRMLRERLQRAKDALNNSDLDALFIFRTEDARYLTGYRHHLGPAFIMGNAVTVLSRNHDPILWTMDFEHCKLRMPWLSPDQIRPRANFREKIGMKRWAEQVEGLTVRYSRRTPAARRGSGGCRRRARRPRRLWLIANGQLPRASSHINHNASTSTITCVRGIFCWLAYASMARSVVLSFSRLGDFKTKW